MKKLSLFFALLSAFLQPILSQDHFLVQASATDLPADSSLALLASASANPLWSRTGSIEPALFSSLRPQKKILLYSAHNQPVEAWYFPGSGNRKALVIGGLHGSELSSIDVARELIQQLLRGNTPTYSVIVIPVLFPDNALTAAGTAKDRVPENTGRYTNDKAADPNRQMPMAGQPFLLQNPVDAYGRTIEDENKALLQLIQTYKPDRLLSIHAIRDPKRAGVFADPRTDCSGTALGFDSDEELALLMAEHIQAFGGRCPGNRLDSGATALYYMDPAIAPPGQKQARSYQVSQLKGKSRGVSVGTWCSTAVCHEEPALNRPAIRTLTMEFPGYLSTAEYKSLQEQEEHRRQVTVYAASIRQYFLNAFCAEERPAAVSTEVAVQ